MSGVVGRLEHMFDTESDPIGLLSGEGTEDIEAEDQLAYRLTCLALADGWVEPDRHVLPDGVELIPTGPYLAAVVSSVDPSRLNGHDAVRLMQAEARLSSHHEAGKLAAMSEVAFSPPGDANSPVERSPGEIEYAAVEIAAALTLTRRAAEAEMERSLSLTGSLRRVWKTLSQGLIDLHKAKVFDQGIGHLPDDTVGQVLDHTLDEASELTTGQLRSRLSKSVMAADPDGTKSSFQEGLEDRRVVASSNPDMTADFHILNSHPDAVAAARANIEKIAKSLKTHGDSRALDQIRSDAALDLLAGKCVNPKHLRRGGGGRVNVTIPATTLARLSDEPGELDGFAPVIAEIARKTVFENIDGQWVFTVTDNGNPVATGTLARRPTEAQKRKIRADYPTCTFPGCRQPAYDCDIDHRRPHSRGGSTCNHNLAPLCRHHHMCRHHAQWEMERLPDGDHDGTSPLGHTYIRKRDPPD